MAKKKEATLSLEERLQAALVPDWEQPYKVPDNWAYYRVSGLAERLKRGKTPKYVETSEYPVFAQKCNQKDGTISMEKAQFLNPGLVEKFDDDEFLKDCDIIVNSTGTGTLGRVGFYRTEIALPYKKVLPDSHITVIRSSRCVFPQYLFFFLKFNQEYLELQGVGTTNQKELKPESIGGIPLPLPPLVEQKRIVDQIESMFSKLDETKEKAQAVVGSFENRKAVILHKAFTGELTEKWRKEHNVDMNSWKEKPLESVCQSIFDGDHMPPPKADTGIPFIFISNVNKGLLSLENVNHVSKEYYNSLSSTRKPQKGDVLYTLVGSYGIPAVVDTDQPFCFQRHMALLKPNNIETDYLWYVLQTKEIFNKVAEIVTGTAQLTIPIKGLRRITIPVPTIDEQIEIVHIANSIRKKEQHAKDAAEAVLDQIDTIKKSILARAFRGELGTNDPNDESAVELLKQII